MTPLRAVAVALFVGGLVLAVRVMFFGVQRRIGEETLLHRKWPLALAAFAMTAGAMLYARGSRPDVTAVWLLLVVLVSAAAAAGAWWLVVRSAALPSTDPEDDPRYRFQGHVARVVKPISSSAAGTITFIFDDKNHELSARWSPEATAVDDHGGVDSEVVIERVEDGVAFVEPWAVVEDRL